jgi:tetratricopeptide (TPR) repeat protein
MLRRSRLAAGLTQEELAARAGLSAAAISTLERGARRSPRKDTIELIADALQLPPAQRTLLLSAAGRRIDEGVALPSASDVRARDAALPFIGRVNELATIESFLATAEPPLLLVAGEPGIGKSRLLREVAQRASSQGSIILEGSCTRRSGQEPYAPITGALENFIQRRSPAQLRSDLQGCSWLTRLLPQLAELTLAPVPQWALPPEQERRLMFAAVERFLGNISAAPGALLMLDDLQWAGDDALDLLDTLVRTSATTHVRLIGAYRDTEARQNDALRTLQGDLAREDLVRRIELRPFAPQEGRALLASLLESGAPEDDSGAETQADDILRRTGGVPFFLVSCARGLRAGIASENSDSAVPWDVGENIRQRVATLPEQAQEMLAVAAIVGREAPGSVLEAVLAWPETDLVTALDAACAVRLLVEDGARYRFAHDLIHEAVVASLSAARRRSLHGRVAGAYERQGSGAPTEILAYHYERSGAREQAAIYLERAGDNAQSVYAYTECERYYGAALAIARDLGARTQEATLCERLGDLFAALGRHEAARSTYEEALVAYQALGDREGVWRSLARITLMGRTLGVTPAAGLERLQPFLADASQALVNEASPALVELYNACGARQSDRRHDEEAVAAHQRAIEVASQLGDLGLEAQSRWWQARAFNRGGWRPADAARVFESTIPLFEALNDLPRLCDTLNNVADYALGGGDFTRARPLIERAVSLAERIQSPPRLAITLCTASELAYQCGDWLQARAGYERVIKLLRESGSDHAVLWHAVCALGQICFVTGAEPQGAAMFDEAVAHDQVELNGALRTLAERDLLDGRPEDAWARFVSTPTHDASGWNIVVDGMPWLAWAGLALGHEEQGVTTLAEYMAKPMPVSVAAEAHYVVGTMALLRKRYAEACVALDDALRLCARAPYLYIQAKALYAYGQTHAAMGDGAQARDCFEQALSILAKLGERLYASHIERALTALG